MRRTYAAALTAAVLVLGLAGCGGDDDARPKIADPTESAPPSPSATEATTPEAPTIPPEALEPTAAGAEAFVPFFWDTVNYAQATGSHKELESLLSPTCDECKAAVRAVKRAKSNGSTIKGGEYDSREIKASEITVNGEVAFSVSFDVHNTNQKIILNGEVVEKFRESTVPIRFILNFADPGWTVDVWEVLRT